MEYPSCCTSLYSRNIPSYFGRTTILTICASTMFATEDPCTKALAIVLFAICIFAFAPFNWLLSYRAFCCERIGFLDLCGCNCVLDLLLMCLVVVAVNAVAINAICARVEAFAI